MNETRHLIVSSENAGLRLDVFITRHINITRQAAQKLIKASYVTMDDRCITQPSRKVTMQASITIIIPPPVPTNIIAEAIPLDILYEDDDVLVINKAAGMVVHPAAGHSKGTLVNALLHHCGDSLSGIGGVMRPGIVHRLDKDTSGLMIVAKHDAAHAHLSAQLEDRSLSRIYTALCWGLMQPQKGTINLPIGRSSRDRKKMAVTDGGRQAITHYTTKESFTDTRGTVYASLVQCKLQTGRTHQIRVHMMQAGCGLIGDATYGPPSSRKLAHYSYVSDTQRHALQHFPRQALHAREITFIHPRHDKPMQFSAPYPADLGALIKALSIHNTSV